MFFMYSSHTRSIIGQVRPGLSGVGSIVFRDEEVYYQQIPNQKNFTLKLLLLSKGFWKNGTSKINPLDYTLFLS